MLKTIQASCHAAAGPRLDSMSIARLNHAESVLDSRRSSNVLILHSDISKTRQGQHTCQAAAVCLPQCSLRGRDCVAIGRNAIAVLLPAVSHVLGSLHVHGVSSNGPGAEDQIRAHVTGSCRASKRECEDKRWKQGVNLLIRGTMLGGSLRRPLTLSGVLTGARAGRPHSSRLRPESAELSTRCHARCHARTPRPESETLQRTPWLKEKQASVLLWRPFDHAGQISCIFPACLIHQRTKTWRASRALHEILPERCQYNHLKAETL